MKTSFSKVSNQKIESATNPDEFDEDYFENGIATGKSCYTNYRWLPELTIKFAHKIIRVLNLREGDKVLDFGCAKGFLVKAFRILEIDAYGCDISQYALNHVDDEIKEYCKRNDKEIVPFDIHFDWIIAKDVLEHLTEEEIDSFLDEMRSKADNIFIIVPLGENDKFNIPAYELDVTHKLAKTRDWWENKFEDHSWTVDRFCYIIPGLKDNWAQWKKGNGFFVLKKN